MIDSFSNQFDCKIGSELDLIETFNLFDCQMRPIFESWKIVEEIKSDSKIVWLR